MTQATYTIDVDTAGKFLKLTLTGDWDVPIAERYAADVGAAVRRMMADGLKYGELRTMVDMRRKRVVPQPVMAIFARMIQPGSPSKRIAMIHSGALHRLQAKRVSDERCRHFDDEEEARAWLFAD